jgi:hypothetical protein
MWVPDARHEALRDLVRAREAGKEDQLRAKHRLGKYLLRYGQRPADGCRAWTAAWWQWVRALHLPHAEQNTTVLDYILEVDHQAQLIVCLMDLWACAGPIRSTEKARQPVCPRRSRAESCLGSLAFSSKGSWAATGRAAWSIPKLN